MPPTEVGRNHESVVERTKTGPIPPGDFSPLQKSLVGTVPRLAQLPMQYCLGKRDRRIVGARHRRSRKGRRIFAGAGLGCFGRNYNRGVKNPFLFGICLGCTWRLWNGVNVFIGEEVHGGPDDRMQAGKCSYVAKFTMEQAAEYPFLGGSKENSP